MLRSFFGLSVVLASVIVWAVAPLAAVEWRFEVVATEISAEARNSSLALDAAGRPHVIFFDENVQEESSLFHAVRTDGGWELSRVEEGVKGSQSVAIFDAAGVLHIFYDNRDSTGSVRYGQLRDGTWQLEDVHTLAIACRGAKMVLDREGQPHVGFWDNGGIDFGSYYGTRDASGWRLERVGGRRLGDSLQIGSIALDADDAPILLGSAAGFDVARIEDGAWTVHPALGPPRFLSFNTASTTGADGRIHVSGVTLDDDLLVYVVGEGLEWSFTLIEETGPMGSATTSIALDPFGNPRISYERDVDRTGRTALRYALFDGEDWTTEPIGAAVSVQSGTTLAIDAAGVPHLAYWRDDDHTGQLVYAVGVEAPPAPTFVRGDSNTDGQVDIADAVWTLSEVFRGGPSTTCRSGADANGDGRRDMADAIFTIAHRLQGGEAPTSPFPDCGPGTETDASLGCEAAAASCR